jgi:3-(3-hydroxy-phenyl)propionate hydroxylase
MSTIHCAMQDRSQPNDIDTDVVIVGYGPVGATLANLLGLRGVRTIVLERESSAYHLPRAVHFDDEVMRIFETIGLSDAIVANTVFSPGMHFIDSAGRLLLDWSRPPGLTPQGWYPSYRFHQPELEAVLRDGLRRWSSVTAMSRCDVFALDEDGDGVRVRFEDLNSGRLLACRAKYVVGCDGARSLVRRFMGAGLDDLGFHERWLVLDFLLGRPRDDLGDHSVQFCDPVRPATYVRGVGNRRRWEITLLADEESHAMTAPERIWPLLKRWVGPQDGRIERAAVYTFHSVVARPWRTGRLLLAGDSAHQTPPFLGQGMCAGIRDAANLAWKLADVVGGRNGDPLLDSYESERSPHVRQYIERAIRLGGIINTKNARETLAELGRKGDETIKFASPKPELGPGLCLEGDPLAGQLAPQPTLSCGTRLDAIAGYSYVLLARPDFACSLSANLKAAVRDAGLRIIDDGAPALQDWLAESRVDAALVRPDRYVLCTARTRDELQMLLRRLPARTRAQPSLIASSSTLEGTS